MMLCYLLEAHLQTQVSITLIKDLLKIEGTIQRFTFSRAAVGRFMQHFFSDQLLDKLLRSNWRKFDEYFQVLASFA
jgi:hypothetical protein